MFSRLTQLIPFFEDKFWRFVRFGIVGGLATLTYAVVSYFLITDIQLGAAISSSLAYLVSVPISFFGQKYFTFNSQGRVIVEVPKFLVVQVINIILCGVIMSVATEVLNFPTVVGIACVVLLIPLASYLMFAALVFNSDKAQKG